MLLELLIDRSEPLVEREDTLYVTLTDAAFSTNLEERDEPGHTHYMMLTSAASGVIPCFLNCLQAYLLIKLWLSTIRSVRVTT